MNVNLPELLALVALGCFVIATLIASTTIGGNFDGWLAGGFVAWAASTITSGLLARRPQ
jgi:tetrahydromethanopterin S-methyltransferase subunit D